MIGLDESEMTVEGELHKRHLHHFFPAKNVLGGNRDRDRDKGRGSGRLDI